MDPKQARSAGQPPSNSKLWIEPPRNNFVQGHLNYSPHWWKSIYILEGWKIRDVTEGWKNRYATEGYMVLLREGRAKMVGTNGW